MRLFVDSGDLGQITSCIERFNISGITTNPKLTSVTSAIQMMRDTNLETSIQIDLDNPEILKDLKNEPLAVIKVPINHPSTIKALVREGFRVNCTLCFTMSHVIAAENLGATYISLFVGRGIDNGLDMYNLVRESAKYVMQSQILAASIRNLQQLEQVAISGAHVATVSPSLLISSLDHRLTISGEVEFNSYKK